MRTADALAISIVADAIDYVVAILFVMRILGDIFYWIVTGILYGKTRSKVSRLLNQLEFFSVIGDFVPTCTISTLRKIFSQSKKKQKTASMQLLFRLRSPCIIVFINPLISQDLINRLI
jgi:hypothetical protein